MLKNTDEVVYHKVLHLRHVVVEALMMVVIMMLMTTMMLVQDDVEARRRWFVLKIKQIQSSPHRTQDTSGDKAPLRTTGLLPLGLNIGQNLVRSLSWRVIPIPVSPARTHQTHQTHLSAAGAAGR